MLGQVRTMKKLHPGGIHYSHGDKELTSDLKRIESTIELKKNEILNFSLNLFCEKIYNLTKQRITQMEEILFNVIKDVTHLAGNVVDAKGKPLSAELLLEMVEKVEITFDADGNYHIPSFAIPPQLTQQANEIQSTIEFQNKFNEIMDRKRKEYNAKKRIRRLSYIDN